MNKVKALVFIILCIAVSSCRLLRPNLMLKTPKGYNYSQVSDTLTKLDYKIAKTDEVEYRVLANDGFKLIDLTNSGTTSNIANRVFLEGTVDKNGNLKLPLLGLVNIQGMTVREAESFLENKYSEFYVKPFVQIRISNKRVIVYPGNPGTAKVVPITNNNMTVFEALAYSGGITEDGKAYKIKLIRRNQDKFEVFLIDLSTIDGINAGNMIVLANDIIYVEPRPRIAQRTVQEIAPYISLLSSAILIYTVFSQAK